MLIDSHCHLNLLDLSSYDNSLRQLFAKEAKYYDNMLMLCVSVDLASLDLVIASANQYPRVFASVGVHPTEANDTPLDIATLSQHTQNPKVIAIGETGMDFYHDVSNKKAQQEYFAAHIELAKQSKCPLIIHMRNATDATFEIMRAENAAEIGGVMHCFCEDWEVAKRAIDLNFYISLSGIVTFKNARQLHQVAREIPLERLLIETDAPYLAPTPYRGKANFPHYVQYVAEHIAQLRGIDSSTVIQQCNDNFFQLFTKAQKYYAN